MYKLKIKRKLFWKTYKNVIGHKFVKDVDKLDIFFKDKIISIPKYSECTLKLGADFLDFQKEEMEKEKGKL